MVQLNLPACNFRIKKQQEKLYIFDEWRKKFVSLTPEEWVRQHFIRYLIEWKKYPASLISIEKTLKINGLSKRYDAVCFDTSANPLILIEFKAPDVPINQKVFDQMAVYNTKLSVSWFILSNGLEHFCCKIDFEAAKYLFFDEIPAFPDIINII